MPREPLRVALVVLTVAVSLSVLTGAGCPPTTNPDTNVQQDTTRVGLYVTNINNAVTIFSLDASGDAAPARVISGPSTGLSLPIGIGHDTQSKLYVANRTAGTVTVYDITANGDAAPVRVLTDPDMGSPEALVVAPGDDVFVSTCPNCGSANGGQTGVFHFANNATSSDTRLGGPANNNTGFTVPGSIAMDENRNLYVGNSFGGNISVFAPGASGDSLPIRSFTPGASVNLQAVAYGSNSLFVSVPGAGIEEFPFTASGSPNASAALNPPDLVYPAGIFVDTSTASPDVYLADYSGDAVYIIHTIGVAPFLTANGITTIKGPSTQLNGPLGVLVVKS